MPQASKIFKQSMVNAVNNQANNSHSFTILCLHKKKPAQLITNKFTVIHLFTKFI